jgi:hypothetical protein
MFFQTIDIILRRILKREPNDFHLFPNLYSVLWSCLQNVETCCFSAPVPMTRCPLFPSSVVSNVETKAFYMFIFFQNINIL